MIDLGWGYRAYPCKSHQLRPLLQPASPPPYTRKNFFTVLIDFVVDFFWISLKPWDGGETGKRFFFLKYIVSINHIYRIVPIFWKINWWSDVPRARGQMSISRKFNNFSCNWISAGWGGPDPPTPTWSAHDSQHVFAKSWRNYCE